MSIGDNIKAKRIEMGLTQEELAKLVNISRPMLAQIERGTKAVTLALSKSIAEELKCNVKDFLS